MKTLFLAYIYLAIFLNIGVVNGQVIPHTMFDMSYSNNYLFFNNPEVVRYNTGDISLKLNNDIEASVMKLLTPNSKSEHHRLFGGIGANYSDYSIKRNLYSEQNNSSHFSNNYSYTPNKLEYDIQLLRFNIKLCHYTFYKKIILFQKIGLAYSAFLKKSNPAAQYEEQYGNSTPMQDAAHVTPDNPNGWYLQNNYTYTNKNDIDIYKNGFSAFYKFGMGVKIKQFTPFVSFEFSNFTSKFWSSYLKFQVGINYSILPH